MLDFAQIAPQIQQFTEMQVHDAPHWEAALQAALGRLHSAEQGWERTRARMEDKTKTRTSWLLAHWRENPHQHIAIEPPSPPFIVMATDGSQIVADRHDFALCYVLNIGTVVLRYGMEERSQMGSKPTLFLPDEELFESPDQEEERLSARRVAIRRLLAEIEALVEEVERLPASAPPALALVDGTLILWILDNETEEYIQETLHRFQECFERVRERRVPIVGYISQPQSRDVINSLRVFACPKTTSHCDNECPRRKKPFYEAPPCAGTERITDADLFGALLKRGERSALFGSGSKILERMDVPHKIAFCYLNTGTEIVRLEMPEWVTQDTQLLEQALSLCQDQAEKGAGYPVALTEAHEQAVIRATERDLFFQLIQKRFTQAHLSLNVTRKALAKRWRRV